MENNLYHGCNWWDFNRIGHRSAHRAWRFRLQPRAKWDSTKI